jgi:hypothetical protein
MQHRIEIIAGSGRFGSERRRRRRILGHDADPATALIHDIHAISLGGLGNLLAKGAGETE